MCHILQTIYIVEELKKNQNQTFRFVLEVFELLVGTIDLIFPLVDGNKLLDRGAAWSQGVLPTAKQIANHQSCSAPSDHMTSSKI